MQIDRAGLEAWQRDQPLSILQLDPADRAVLRVAGLSYSSCYDQHLHFAFVIWDFQKI